MPFTTNHSVEKGIVRLMAAPRDLPPVAPWRDPPLPRVDAHERYQRLFEEYEEDMDEALELAEAWWEEGIQEALQGGMSRKDVMDSAYCRAFAGPAGLPEMIWVVRKFWLRCVEVNKDLLEAQRVPPEVFLLHWLNDGEHVDHVQVLTGMPYWPIGLDEEGNWV